MSKQLLKSDIVKNAKKDYCKVLIKWFHDNNRGKDYSLVGIKELLRLVEQAGLGTPIPKTDLKIPYGVGRWWRHSTGVLDRRNDPNGRVFYRIRSEFYQALKQALTEFDNEKPAKRRNLNA